MNTISTTQDPMEIIINDVTLRDGAQAPGNTMTKEEMFTMAMQLHALGVNGIEAGFPNSSEEDFLAVQKIAAEIGNMPMSNPSVFSNYVRISGLARLHRGDIVRTIEAVQQAKNPGVHTFISTSLEQVVKFSSAIEKAGGTPGNMNDFMHKVVLPGIEQELPYIRSELPNGVIQFSPEDWVRSEDTFANEAILAAAQNGADVINLPDTVGIAIPSEIAERVRAVRELLNNNGYANVIVSWHGHNDTGTAVANAMQAIHSGAQQVETTILGIGERTGNIAFEGFLSALDANHQRNEELTYEMRLHPLDRYQYREAVGNGTQSKLRVPLVDTLVRSETMRTAQLLSTIIQKPIADEHPIVGASANAHESGIHADGVSKGKNSGQNNVYEINDPELYGAKSVIVIGQQSGWANLQEFMQKHNLPYCQPYREIMTNYMKRATQGRRKGLSDKEVLRQVYYPAVVELTGGPHVSKIKVLKNSDRFTEVFVQTPEALITGKADQEAEGGVIAAAINSFKKIIPTIDVADFTVKIAPKSTKGADAPAIVQLELANGHVVSVEARHNDTTTAIRQALIDAFNVLYAIEKIYVASK